MRKDREQEVRCFKRIGIEHIKKKKDVEELMTMETE